LSISKPTYTAKVSWNRDDQIFIDNKYSRAHQWEFDGGVKVPASASSHIVPLPYSVEANVDPEEAFIASISSCHMLFFLGIAAKKKLIIDSYYDQAKGILEENSDGFLAMTHVTLDPVIIFSNKQPSEAMIKKIHHLSHQQCFIANSVKSQIIIKGYE